jgi:heptosyltransferase-2
VLGNRGEKGLTAQVAQAAGNAALDLGGQTDLPLAAALLSRAKVLLSNDSGLMHLAEAVGTPVVALFGSTVPDLGFRPWRPESRVLGVDLPCRPCHVHGRKSCPLGHFECMRGLAVERALDAVAGLLP